MQKHHALSISSIEKNTPETVVVTFDVPKALQEEYTYKQGQHITLIKNFEGEELRRSYSICSGVSEKSLCVAIRQVNDGRFSTFANDDLKVGDSLEVLAPAGHFYIDLDENAERTFVAFAAGSGITPIMSIIKTTLEREPKSRFLLFYGNRSASSTIFRDELAGLKNRYMDRFSLYHFLSQEERDVDFFNSRLDEATVSRILETIIKPGDIDHAFICGPEAMIDDVADALQKAGLAKDAVHFEKFLSEGQKAVAPVRAQDVEGLAKLKFIIDGDEKTVKSDHSKALLDAAIDSGLDVPYGCKGAVCCTCRARVVSGEVEMTLNQGLEPEEVEAGYVLTCHSFAISDAVTISFDD